MLIKPTLQPDLKKISHISPKNCMLSISCQIICFPDCFNRPANDLGLRHNVLKIRKLHEIVLRKQWIYGADSECGAQHLLRIGTKEDGMNEYRYIVCSAI